MINIDKDYINNIRREIHQYPEVDFELPKTIALVKRELDKIGIPYTEEYGKSRYDMCSCKKPYASLRL